MDLHSWSFDVFEFYRRIVENGLERNISSLRNWLGVKGPIKREKIGSKNFKFLSVDW